MKAKKPPYTISLYRTTNGIFPTIEFNNSHLPKSVAPFKSLSTDTSYKTDASAKRGILRLARKMGLLSKVQERGCGGSVQ